MGTFNDKATTYLSKLASQALGTVTEPHKAEVSTVQPPSLALGRKPACASTARASRHSALASNAERPF
jgi:hypothetical protein